MSSDYRTFSSEFKWSQTWIPRMRQLIGPCLLREATITEDQREATDLIVLKAEGLRIACRVRRPGYAHKWPNDITITCRHETGVACEWDKMIEGGMGDWFFYGHATSPVAIEGDILPRYLIDLGCARQWIRDNHGPERGPNKGFPGERCWFYAIDVIKMNRALNGKAVIAQQRVAPHLEPSGRRCEICGHSHYSDGRRMEISFAHGLDKWACFSCFAFWQDHADSPSLRT